MGLGIESDLGGDTLGGMSLLNQDRRDKKEIVLRSERRAF